MTENGKGLVDIGKLILQFARVDRVTFHDDGVTPESDTDHTVMVAVCACALAAKLYPDLDRGLIAQFAIIHDLVEVYASDTDSFGLSAEDRSKKEEREHEAYLKIKHEFTEVFPWIPDTIARYESLDTKEARFVKTVDKCTPKLTHILNKGVCFKNKNLARDDMWHEYQTMVREVEVRYGKEFPELIALIDELIEVSRIKTYGS